jgi:hypothetical protein
MDWLTKRKIVVQVPQRKEARAEELRGFSLYVKGRRCGVPMRPELRGFSLYNMKERWSFLKTRVKWIFSVREGTERWSFLTRVKRISLYVIGRRGGLSCKTRVKGTVA